MINQATAQLAELRPLFDLLESSRITELTIGFACYASLKWAAAPLELSSVPYSLPPEARGYIPALTSFIEGYCRQLARGSTLNLNSICGSVQILPFGNRMYIEYTMYSHSSNEASFTLEGAPCN